MLANPLKMVIWDLDETFWSGTLSEGAVAIPKENLEILATLSRRGIVSSICSKNDYNAARRVLENNGAWPYFVFPAIAFASKGAAVAELIARANLRPDNVLFIDDNRLNLAEARRHSPALMTAHPREILPLLLALPQAAGKIDEGMTRLAQYKQLESKIAAMAFAGAGDEVFLRQCEVRVEIDIDVESNLERVIELINRSNQLNFTKKRLETEAAIAEFKAQLRKYGFHAGIIRVADKYADYGIAGFFMTSRFYGVYNLRHFVFSCRIMNMGVEQYVHKRLGEPQCAIVGPVSYGLKTFPEVDWIRPGTDRDALRTMPANDERMLLIGGCDLLQTATYLSANRFEYVNRNNRGEVARYDDPGFVLSSREAISASEALPQLTSWTKEDVLRFDADLGNSDTIVVSFSHALSGEYLELPDGVMVRIPYARVARDTLPSGAHYLQLCLAQKLEWIARSFDRIAELSPAAERRFVLGANTRGGDNSHFEDQKAYNRMASRYCERRGGYEFVSVDEIVPESELLDAFHFTRKGYFALARELRRRIDRSVEAEAFLFSASPPPQGFLAQSVDPTLSALGALIAE